MMSELSAPKVLPKKDWITSPRTFQRLLNWLDEGEASDGHKYLRMRVRLVGYFDRKNCLTPDELADETLNRVARRLEEDGITESDTPAKYCYIVARFVFMESLRATKKNDALLEDVRRQPHGNHVTGFEADNRKDTKEKMLNCLEQCTDRLEPLNRELITRYYTGQERVKIENRRRLAQELGISVNALSIRACRIRDKLEACIRQCLGAE